MQKNQSNWTPLSVGIQLSMSNLHRLFAEAQITDSFNQTGVWSHPFYCAFSFLIIGQHHKVAKKNA